MLLIMLTPASVRSSERAGRRVTLVVFIIAFPWTLVMSGQAIGAAYANRAIAHYHQSLAIVSPHLDAASEEVSRSRFAQIQSSEDYAAVIDELERVAEDNGLELPDFTIW